MHVDRDNRDLNEHEKDDRLFAKGAESFKKFLKKLKRGRSLAVLDKKRLKIFQEETRGEGKGRKGQGLGVWMAKGKRGVSFRGGRGILEGLGVEEI